jgi:hypothetical protein
VSTSVATARPTRRAIVRGAAWSVPVVAIATTAPAFAVSTSSSLTWVNAPVKWGGQGDKKHVSWDLVLTNGTRVIDRVVFTFTYYRANNTAYAGEAFSIYNFAPTANTTAWTGVTVTNAGQVVTAANAGDVAAYGVVNIHTDFSGDDNSVGSITVSAEITYKTGSPETLTLTKVPFGQAPGGGNSEPSPHDQH